jgi:hypothetical protein
MDRRRDRLPEAVRVGLAEDHPRPTLVRAGDHGPVAVAVGEVEAHPGELLHAGAREPSAVQAREEVGIGIAGDRDQRAMLVPEVEKPPHEPGRRPVEHLRRRLLDVRSPDTLVDEEAVDIAGAGDVALDRKCPCERRMLEEAVDCENLAGLQVDAHADGETRVGSERWPEVGHQTFQRTRGLSRLPACSVEGLEFLGWG